jgi:hypothetical protein
MEVLMDKNAAIRIDGMLIGARAYLDGVAHYMKENVSSEEYQSCIKLIGAAMAETVELSSLV